MLVRLWRGLGFHVHAWGKWEQAGDVRTRHGEHMLGVIQRRQCSECGLQQFKVETLL